MRERVSAARVARLATIAADGRPHLVPVAFALHGDVLFWAVDDKPKSTRRLRRLEHIGRDPRVSVLVDHYAEDWQQLWWVRIDGRASVLGPGAESDLALDLLASRYEVHRRRRPPGPVVAIVCERWTGWSAA